MTRSRRDKKVEGDSQDNPDRDVVPADNKEIHPFVTQIGDPVEKEEE